MNDVTGEEMPVSGHCFFFLILSCLSQTDVKQSVWSSPSAKQRQNPFTRPPPVYQDFS